MRPKKCLCVCAVKGAKKYSSRLREQLKARILVKKEASIPPYPVAKKGYYLLEMFE